MVNVLHDEYECSNISDHYELYLSGVLMTTGTMANGNIYPTKIIKDAVVEFNKSSNRLGYFGRLTDNKSNILEVSHEICDIYMDGINVMGKLKILDTSTGNKVKKLLQDGIKFSATSRMMGTLDKTQTLTFATICSWDILIAG